MFQGLHESDEQARDQVGSGNEGTVHRMIKGTGRKQGRGTLKTKEDKARHDKRYFLGAYGTFDMDSVHGRLFELQVYIDCMKNHTFVYFAFTVVGLLLWPIAALFVVPLSYIAGNNKDLQILKVILVLATTIGLVLWTVPIFIVSLGGGIEHFHDLIMRQELAFLDFVDFILSELMILLTVLFAWVFHEITINTTKYKDSAALSWRYSHDEYGSNVRFGKQQFERLCKVLSPETQVVRPPGEHSGDHAEDDYGGTIPIEDVVMILEALPGWNSRVDYEVMDYFEEKTGIPTGLYGALEDLTDEAREKNLWPIDLWMVRDQFYPENVLELDVGLYVFYKNTIDLLSISFEFICGNKPAFFLIFFLAATRAMLPRFWLWLVLGGRLWPADVHGPAGRLVFYSTSVTFCVSIIWIGLFWFVLMEYRRNIVQCMIVSSLIDARARVLFSQNFLMSSMWFGLDSRQAEAALSKLPLLDLRISSNVAAFWRIRDYCTLDRSNERMSICVLLEIVIIWLLLKFVITLSVMYIHGGLPAILAVTIFDLIVFGSLIILALHCALKMNDIMDGQKRVFVEAKYEVTMESRLCSQRRGHCPSHKGRQAPPEEIVNEPKKDIDICRRLLEEYIDNVHDADCRDKILFGMVITPGKIVSSAGSVGLMVYTLINKMIQNHEIDVPDSMEQKVAATQVSLMAMQSTVTTVKFLARHARPLLRWGA